MEKMNCKIVQDLLPLYIDGVVSDATKEMVEDHVKTCETCQKELALLRRDLVLPANEQVKRSEAKMLKALKAAMRRKKAGIALLSVVVTAVLLSALIFFLTISKTCIPYDDGLFTVEEVDGNLYAAYHGDLFSGSCAYEGSAKAGAGNQKQSVFFYAYTTPWDRLMQRISRENTESDHLIHLGKAGEIEAVYYGKFTVTAPDIDMSTWIRQGTLMWED